MKNLLLIFIVLVFVGQACESQESNESKDLKLSRSGDSNEVSTSPTPPPSDPDPCPSEPESIVVCDIAVCMQSLIYNNASDYLISVSPYQCGSERLGRISLDPGEQHTEEMGIYGKENTEHLRRNRNLPLFRYNNHRCKGGTPLDSIRIYFNRGKSDERYVTHREDGFRPRDIRDPQEYVVHEEGEDYCPTDKYYYTFTNADYDNAEKHQNATPTPIPECFWHEPSCH